MNSEARPRISDSTRRDFLRQVGALGLALSAGSFLEGCVSDGGELPPNIVLIFMDDLGYADIGAYGAEGYRTPNLDRLAAEGMVFTDFYASQAVCSASRASLLTGCYAERVSIRGALSPSAEVGLHPDETTIAEMLKNLGYATGIFGKWHLGNHPEFLPLQRGFDEYLGLPYSNDMWPVGYDGTPATEGSKAAHPPLPLIEGNEVAELIEDQAGQDKLTGLYTQRSVDFIRRHADEPFFLYLAHSMVHVPLGVSDRFRGRTEQGMFGDVMEEVDWSVGQVMDALDGEGLADNTLLIFTSDNGPWLNFGNHAGSAEPLREGKGTAFEGGPRVPSVWRWPGRIEPGSVSSRMASTLDVLPTLASITGAPLPESPIDGVDILPLLHGEAGANPRNQFLFYYDGQLRGIREGRWKRVYEHRTRSYVGVEPGMDGLPGPYAFPTVPEALYDLENDVGETTDVSANHPDVVARLDALAEEARMALGDRLRGIVGSEVRPPGRMGFDRGEMVEHLAVGASVTLATPPSPSYPGTGPGGLCDGNLGTRDHHDPRWMAWSGDDLEATIDLGTPRVVKTVGVDCLRAQEPWIFLPRWVEIALSADGREWVTAGRTEVPRERNGDKAAVRVEVTLPDLGPGEDRTRFVRVRARNHGPLPDWHPGTPENAWLFVDEIVVTGE
ncbi:MAG: sulfatase-like hydrolase/transferase [Gemmatimonadota bacterium]|jgi:arylsulfatase